MELNKYQEEALALSFFKHEDLSYCALGISGEAGEVADHVKKMLRDDNGVITPERRENLKKELGDVLWYLSRMAGNLGYTLDEVATSNIEKIKDRRSRNVLHGSGDNR